MFYGVSNPEECKTEVKVRDTLYRLIISQLFYDGHQHLAVTLSNLIQTTPACPPSDRLLHLVNLGLKCEEAKCQEQVLNADGDVFNGLDFDYRSDSSIETPDASKYETCYVTAHKAPCRTAAFDPSGTVIATGSVDASIKILDVDRMLAKSAMPIDVQEAMQQSMENHPVIRTLYDHADEVTHLEFHPREALLASGSKDYTIKFFEYAKPTTKKSFKVIQEAEFVRCFNFHPTGEWLLVGTEQPTLRLYRVDTFQCYVSSNPHDQHVKPITCVVWAPNARIFASASKDGTIKLWDGVSNKCINTITEAHGGFEVCSIVFTKNSKYLLSSGKDSQVRLWELSTSRCLIHYTGAGSMGKQEHRSAAVFNHAEDYVLFPDEKTISLCCWDARNAERQKLLSLGHNSVVKSIVHSPVYPAFVSCSDDFRARFWCRKQSLDN